ncbi:hypothetical protein CPC08DRAFT_474766 [Agrocybe pediades]|nr:hypothetical protein CPC08DRAFT_474766 [Agrocybe pediades]
MSGWPRCLAASQAFVQFAIFHLAIFHSQIPNSRSASPINRFVTETQSTGLVSTAQQIEHAHAVHSNELLCILLRCYGNKTIKEKKKSRGVTAVQVAKPGLHCALRVKTTRSPSAVVILDQALYEMKWLSEAVAIRHIHCVQIVRCETQKFPTHHRLTLPCDQHKCLIT